MRKLKMIAKIYKKYEVLNMKKFIKETSKKFATGALAILATIGSAGAAGTQTITFDTSPKEFTIEHQTYTDARGAIPVKGYQTSKVYNYEMNVSWGDMKFVFDRGVYDTTNNRLTKKVTGGCWAYCEAGAVPNEAAAAPGQGVGKWCGFDGSKNKVTIENKGNGDVGLGVSCDEGVSANESSTTHPTVDLQLAVKDGDVSADGWTIPGEGSFVTGKKMRTAENTVSDMQIASLSESMATTVIQKQFDLSGSVASSQPDANKVEFWLNLTGDPTDGFATSDLAPENVQAADWGELGSIVLNFTPQT